MTAHAVPCLKGSWFWNMDMLWALVATFKGMKPMVGCLPQLPVSKQKLEQIWPYHLNLFPKTRWEDTPSISKHDHTCNSKLEGVMVLKHGCAMGPSSNNQRHGTNGMPPTTTTGLKTEVGANIIHACSHLFVHPTLVSSTCADNIQLRGLYVRSWACYLTVATKSASLLATCTDWVGLPDLLLKIRLAWAPHNHCCWAWTWIRSCGIWASSEFLIFFICKSS